jgi:hypothetical protein
MPVNTLIILGGGGGVVALLGGVVVVGRGIFRQVTATEDNTDALKALTGKVENLSQTASGHETRIAILEDRVRRDQASH